MYKIKSYCIHSVKSDFLYRIAQNYSKVANLSHSTHKVLRSIGRYIKNKCKSFKNTWYMNEDQRKRKEAKNENNRK